MKKLKLQSPALPIAIVLFLGVVYLLAWSPVFSVRSIATSGLPSTISEQYIVTKSGVVTGEKLSRIEPRSVERAIGEISWIKNVSVSRNWINGQVKISLSTRVPIGIYKGRAIDASGALFEIPGKTPSGLPVVTASNPTLGLAAIDLFTHLPLDLREGALSVSASRESSISSWQVISGKKIKVMWGSAEQMELKVTVFKALLELPENKNIKRVDLSAPHAPIVK